MKLKITTALVLLIFATGFLLNAQNSNLSKCTIPGKEHSKKRTLLSGQDYKTKPYVISKANTKKMLAINPKGIIASENFEGGAMPAGWSEQLGAATDSWTFNSNASSAFWNIAPHTVYAAINDDPCNCDMSDVYLITESYDFSGVSSPVLAMECITSSTGFLNELFTIKSSIDGGTTWNDVDTLGYNNMWHAVEVDLSALAGQPDVKLAFHYNDDGAWGYGMAIDDVLIYEPEPHDLGIESILPNIAQVNVPFIPQVTIHNYGSSDEATWSVELTDGVSYNETVSNPSAITANNDLVVNFPGYTATAEGTISFSASINLAGDIELANNQLTTTFSAFDGAWSTCSSTLNSPTYLGAGAYNADDNLLYVIGGGETSTKLSIYNVVAKKWSEGTNLPGEMLVGSAAYAGGKIYVAPGSTVTTNEYTDRFWAYDVATDAWDESVASLPASIAWTRMAHSSEKNGLYLVGGIDINSNTLSTVYFYDIAEGNWTTATNLPAPRFGGVLVLADDGNLYYVAGVEADHTNTVFKGVIDATDATVITWSEVANLPVAIFKHHGAPFGKGKIIVSGGNDGAGGNGWSTIPDSYIYEIATDTWSKTGDKPHACLGGSEGYFEIEDATVFAVATGWDGSAYLTTTDIYQEGTFGSNAVTFSVTDGTNPIEAANIKFGNFYIATNDAGIATLDAINDTYYYTASIYGYYPVSGTITVTGAAVTENITLIPQPIYTATFTVTDNSDNSPIQNATVSIDGSNYTTNASGVADIDLFDGSTYNYTVSAPDYITATGTITVAGAPITENVGLDISTEPPFGLVVANITESSAEFSWNNETVFSDDFESYDDFVLEFSPWILNDVDGLQTYGYSDVVFPNNKSAMAGIIMNPGQTTPPLIEPLAHSGNKYLATFNPFDASACDDWIIAPQTQISSGDVVSFWATAGHSDYALEKFQVLVSTTGTNPDDFTPISNIITCPNGIVEWVQYTYSLDDFAGQNAYVAIHVTSADQFFFCVDDFAIGRASKLSKKLIGFNVFLDGEPVAINQTEASYVFTGLSPETNYTAGVQAVYDAGISELVTKNFTTASEKWNVIFTVTDENDVAIEGATITINGETLTTDAGGNATIENLIDGSYAYNVIFDGYISQDGNAIVNGADLYIKVNMPVGISDFEALGISIYPNPSNGEFIVKAKGTNKVSIMNIAGEIIYTTTLTDEGLIDLTNQPSGVYVMQLKTNEKAINIRVLVK